MKVMQFPRCSVEKEQLSAISVLVRFQTSSKKNTWGFAPLFCSLLPEEDARVGDKTQRRYLLDGRRKEVETFAGKRPDLPPNTSSVCLTDILVMSSRHDVSGERKRKVLDCDRREIEVKGSKH